MAASPSPRAGYSPVVFRASPGSEELSIRCELATDVAAQATDDDGRRVVIYRMADGRFLLLKVVMRGPKVALDLCGPFDVLQQECGLARLGRFPGPDMFKASVGAPSVALEKARVWESQRRASEEKQRAEQRAKRS